MIKDRDYIIRATAADGQIRCICCDDQGGSWNRQEAP